MLQFFLCAFMRAPDGTVHLINVDDIPGDWGQHAQSKEGMYLVSGVYTREEDPDEMTPPTLDEMEEAIVRLSNTGKVGTATLTLTEQTS